MSSENLNEALDNLAKNKDHMISEQAKAASQQEASLVQEIVDDEDLLEDLMGQVKLLNVLIKRSHLDEIVLFLAQPYRIYPINILLGFTKGLGFGLGLLLVWFCYEYFIQV